MKNIKVLGIDPSSQKVGWSIAGYNKIYHFGLVKVKGDLEDRLGKLVAELAYLFRHYSFDHVAFETSFVQRKNAAIPLGRAQGIIITLAEIYGKSWACYAPSEVKKAVLKGNADKKEVAIAVSSLFNLSTTGLVDDITDSMAVSYCHLKEISSV